MEPMSWPRPRPQHVDSAVQIGRLGLVTRRNEGDRGVYDDLPDGLVVADGRGSVVVFNTAASRITGVDVEAAVGKDLDAALPLEGLDGRAWWPCANPYR